MRGSRWVLFAVLAMTALPAGAASGPATPAQEIFQCQGQGQATIHTDNAAGIVGDLEAQGAGRCRDGRLRPYDLTWELHEPGLGAYCVFPGGNPVHISRTSAKLLLQDADGNVMEFRQQWRNELNVQRLTPFPTPIDRHWQGFVFAEGENLTLPSDRDPPIGLFELHALRGNWKSGCESGGDDTWTVGPVPIRMHVAFSPRLD